MSASLVDQCSASTVLEAVGSAGERRTAGGARLSLATATVGERRILLAKTDAQGAAEVAEAAVLAESMGMLSLTLASSPLSGSLPVSVRQGPPLQAVHAVVGPVTAPATVGALEAAGLIHVAVGASAPLAPFLAADDPYAAIDRAALLLSYLRAPDGAAPVYAPADVPDLDALASARVRNAVATVFRVADDALRVLPQHADEAVLAVGRVHGASVVIIAPQPLAGPTLGQATLGRIEALLRFAVRTALPVLILGGLQQPEGDDELTVLALQRIATQLSVLRGPVLIVPDDAPVSSLSATFAAAPRALTIDASAGLRATIASLIPFSS